MKKTISTILIFTIIFVMGFNCFGFAAEGQQEDDVYSYSPGLSIQTSFGTILFLDAAFCRSTEGPSYGTEASPVSVYVPVQDGFVQLGIKAILMNTTDENYMYSNIHSIIQFGENEAKTLNIYPHEFIANEAYTTLRSGVTEYICLCGIVPLDQYVSSKTALIEFDNAKIQFDFSELKMYSSMGYGENDCKEITLAELLAPASSQQAAPAQTPEPTETPVEIISGTVEESSESTGEKAVGDAVTIQNVSVGFTDQLPKWVSSSLSLSYSGIKDQYDIKSNQFYALVSFTITNNTKKEITLADLHDNFMVELNFNSGFIYNTDGNDTCIFESDNNVALVRHNMSFGSGSLTLAPLDTKNVRLLIPCPESVGAETDKSLVVTFLSTYSGRETFNFRIR